MTIVYLNYFCSNTYDNPEDWLLKMQPVHVVLEQLAVNHKVISIQQIGYVGQITKNGVDYRFVNLYKKPTLLPFSLNVLVKKLKADVIIIHGTVFPIQTILLRLLIGTNVTIIIQHHAELPFSGLKKIAQKVASLFVKAYFFPAKNTGEIWQEKGNIVPTKRIFSIHEGTSVFKLIATENARLITQVNGSPVYIWVGRLDINKHPLLAIKSFSKFLEIQPSAKLYLLFYRDELLDEITNYLLQNEFLTTQIILVGNVAYHEMAIWYSSADFYISSSNKEGTSFTLSEAMSCGCTPIVTNIPTHIDMLGNNCGLMYEAGNEAALFKALVASVNLSVESESLKTLQQYNQYLSASAIANNIENALANLK